MTVSPEGVVIVLACLGNAGAWLYRQGSISARLTAIERILTNGLSDKVELHGKAIAALQAVREAID